MLDYVHTKELGDVPSFAYALYRMRCDKLKETTVARPITEKNGVYYLPYSSNQYEIYSLLDLLDGKIDSAIYKDKIVLIGMCYPGTNDVFHTPLSSTSVMYGVMLHANAIAAYERGFFPRELNDNWQLLFFFIICAITGCFFRNLKIEYSIGLWLGLSVLSTLCCWFVYQCGFILHPSWIPTAATVLFILSLIRNYLQVKADHIRINGIFGRYFDETVMKQLLAEDSDELKLGGKEREIAVLFIDIRGFTTMSEKLPVSDVVEILNDYFKLITECVRKYQGTLDKFIGDCAMAFWNAPYPQKDAALLASRAAADMIDGIAKLKTKVKTKYKWDFSFGIGIHWGEAVVGNIGSELRMDYTAIGDTVNTAARLEANAGGGEIYISREVADILGDLAKIETLPSPIKLKGKGNTVEVLKLVALEGKTIGVKEEL